MTQQTVHVQQKTIPVDPVHADETTTSRTAATYPDYVVVVVAEFPGQRSLVVTIGLYVHVDVTNLARQDLVVKLT